MSVVQNIIYYPHFTDGKIKAWWAENRFSPEHQQWSLEPPKSHQYSHLDVQQWVWHITVTENTAVNIWFQLAMQLSIPALTTLLPWNITQRHWKLFIVIVKKLNKRYWYFNKCMWKHSDLPNVFEPSYKTFKFVFLLSTCHYD